MTDADRLRRAIDGGVGGGPHDELTAGEVARAIVREFGLKRDEYGVDMMRPSLEAFVDAFLDVAEADEAKRVERSDHDE